jgi:fructokinase
MPSPNEQLVLGVGEVLWDCFASGRRPGGAPGNVIHHVRLLGHRGVLCSRIGADDSGAKLRQSLEEHGVELELLQIDTKRPTGRVTVDTSDPSDPRFEIHTGVAWDEIELTAGLESSVRDSSAVVVGTLAQRSPRSRETIQRCLDLASHALTVYDVNLRPPYFHGDWIETTLRKVRVIKLNDQEVLDLSRMFDMSSVPAEFARSMIDRYGAELVCVTRGADGCLVVSGDESYEDPGRPVNVADTVGAGDAFTAGLISGLLRGWGPRRSARLANRIGALVAARPGAMPDLGDAVPELLAEVAGDRDPGPV